MVKHQDTTDSNNQDLYAFQSHEDYLKEDAVSTGAGDSVLDVKAQQQASQPGMSLLHSQ